MYELLSGLQQSCQHAVSDSDRQARERKRYQYLKAYCYTISTLISIVSGSEYL